jgi:hypothetical protein
MAPAERGVGCQVSAPSPKFWKYIEIEKKKAVYQTMPKFRSIKEIFFYFAYASAVSKHIPKRLKRNRVNKISGCPPPPPENPMIARSLGKESRRYPC